MSADGRILGFHLSQTYRCRFEGKGRAVMVLTILTSSICHLHAMFHIKPFYPKTSSATLCTLRPSSRPCSSRCPPLLVAFPAALPRSSPQIPFLLDIPPVPSYKPDSDSLIIPSQPDRREMPPSQLSHNHISPTIKLVSYIHWMIPSRSVVL